MTDKNKHFEFYLPVWKKGDDMRQHLSHEPTVADAFLAHAAQMDECARILRRMASVASEVPEMTVDADCHSIRVNGPEDKLAGLVADGLLVYDRFSEEEEDGLEDFCEDDWPENVDGRPDEEDRLHHDDSQG